MAATRTKHLEGPDGILSTICYNISPDWHYTTSNVRTKAQLLPDLVLMWNDGKVLLTSPKFVIACWTTHWDRLRTTGPTSRNMLKHRDSLQGLNTNNSDNPKRFQSTMECKWTTNLCLHRSKTTQINCNFVRIETTLLPLFYNDNKMSLVEFGMPKRLPTMV